jgi:hypothetical protein
MEVTTSRRQTSQRAHWATRTSHVVGVSEDPTRARGARGAERRGTVLAPGASPARRRRRTLVERSADETAQKLCGDLDLPMKGSVQREELGGARVVSQARS